MAVVPVLVEEGHGCHRMKHLQFADCPAGPVHTLFWKLDGKQTMAGQHLQRGVKGAADERLAGLWFKHVGEVLKIDKDKETESCITKYLFMKISLGTDRSD